MTISDCCISLKMKKKIGCVGNCGYAPASVKSYYARWSYILLPLWPLWGCLQVVGIGSNNYKGYEIGYNWRQMRSSQGEKSMAIKTLKWIDFLNCDDLPLFISNLSFWDAFCQVVKIVGNILRQEVDVTNGQYHSNGTNWKLDQNRDFSSTKFAFKSQYGTLNKVEEIIKRTTASSQVY